VAKGENYAGFGSFYRRRDEAVEWRQRQGLTDRCPPDAVVASNNWPVVCGGRLNKKEQLSFWHEVQMPNGILITKSESDSSFNLA
jgi:hypothetical protein